MVRVLVALSVLGFTFAALAFLMERVFKSSPYAKYVPALTALLAAIYNFILVRVDPGEGFQDLARILLSMLLMSGFVGGLLGALYLEFWPKRKNKKL